MTQSDGSELIGDDPRASRRSHVVDLYALVYVSTAARRLSLNETCHLMERAQTRNREEGATGVLLYSDRSFMQYLEGPALGLARVCEAIRADPLHYGIIELVREPIQSREFSEWSMASQVVGAFDTSSPTQQDAVLSERLAISTQPSSAARSLLSKFWSIGRVSIASNLLDLSSKRTKRAQPARLELRSAG